MASASSAPKVFVFDLDGCVWYPEMYHLWGGGGAPFKVKADGNLTDRSGTTVTLMADVRSIMHELKTDPKWAGSTVAVASGCDEPEWGREAISKFGIGDGFTLKDVFKHIEIYKGAKSHHLQAISRKTGVDLKDMIFFDNEYGNCQTVAKIGVTVLYTPEGVCRKDFEDAMKQFPAPGQILGPKKKSHW